MQKNDTFSKETVRQALRDLGKGKTVDQYDLPVAVKHSISMTRYSSQDISEAFAKVEKPKRVLPF